MPYSRRSFLRAAGALAAAPLVSRLPRPSRAASQFDPDFGSASEALEAMARGAISSRELVEHTYRRIRKHNPRVNALITLTEESALARAKQADQARAAGKSWGPLHGLPILIKDTFETAGVKTTAGSKLLGTHVPKEDAIAVSRLLEAGAVLVGKTKDAKPAYYYVFVTAYKDGVIPRELEGRVAKDQVLAEVIAVAPDQMEQRMSFVNSDEMSRSLTDTGKVSLYGIYFDTDKDVVRPDSQPTLVEIQKLLRADPQLKVHVVGHTDNQGNAAHNLDLSRRRAASVVGELTAKYGITADRLDAFGCGFYAPVASNTAEEGRAKNRRVELVKW